MVGFVDGDKRGPDKLVLGVGREYGRQPPTSLKAPPGGITSGALEISAENFCAKFFGLRPRPRV